MLDVYLYDVQVGSLVARGRGIRFTYSAGALANDHVHALSLSLPKQPDPFPDSRAGPFFRNLLPEQAYRRLVATAVGTAPENSIALLGAIGGECPGAVSLWPVGFGPPKNPEYEPLDDAQLLALFSPTNTQPLGSAITRGRLSLAGVQEKIALLRDANGEWLLPLRGAVTSHILKQATPDFPHILGNEAFCVELARRCGLPVPVTALASPGVRVLCTERFDRLPAPTFGRSPCVKVHQEDFCQVLGVNPERKYEADGGPGFKKCAEVIRRFSSLPAEDLFRLAQWAGYNYLIGNEDAHAKNLAILYRPDGLRLAPHYDLVSTEVYPGLERALAMKLGRSWDIRNVQRSDWQRLADGLGIPWENVRTTLRELVGRLRRHLPQVLAETSAAFGSSPICGEIAKVAEGHSSKLETATQ